MFGKRNCTTFLALMLIVALTLTLAGCGGGNPAGGEKKAESPAGDVIKIGTNFEMTGGQATFGQAALNGVKLAFKQKNEAGGVLGGKKFEAVSGDNKSAPEESANVVTKLIDQDKVVAIIGATTSSNTLASIPIATQKQIPVVSSSATNPKVTVNEADGKTNEFAFRACFIDPFQGTVMANFAAKDLKAKKAVILIDSSSDYSKGLAKFFKEAFINNGGEILGEEAYVQKDSDFKAVLTKIKGLNPEAIFVPGYYEEVGKIVKQGRELGITVPFMGGDGWDSPKLVEIAGAAALNNTFFSNHYASTDPDPKIVKFVADYQKEYGSVPDSMAVLGYDAALMVINAVEKAGSAEPVKIKDALVATKDLEAVTAKITLNEKHDPIKAAAILEMKDGKQVFRAKVNP